MGKLQEYVQRIYFNYHKAMANYNETGITSDISDAISIDHQAIVWLYGKIETLNKIQDKAEANFLELRGEKKDLESKLKTTDANLSTCRKHNERLNDKLTFRSLTLEDRTKDLEELENTYEDHKRFLKYMVLMSTFAGFMMGMASYQLM